MISTSTFGAGNSGNLTVRAAEAIELVGTNELQVSGLFAVALENATGDAGRILLETTRLFLDSGTEISSETFGAGNGGDLTARASESIVLQGFDPEGEASAILTGTLENSTGNAGRLVLETTRLLLDDGAMLSSDTIGAGNGGTLTVRASESIVLRGLDGDGEASSIVSQSSAENAGNAGNLTIETGRLVLDDGAFVSSLTFGEGNGADLTIFASESLELRGLDRMGLGSFVLSSVEGNARGNAGNLEITTGRLSLQDMSAISAGTNGEGNGGDLTIRAIASIDITGGSILNTATAGGGNAGNLTIATEDFTVRNDGRVLVSGAGDFPAGTLTIAADNILLDSGGSLFADTESGDRGNIVLQTRDLQLRRGGFISASALGSSTGGNVTIGTDTIVLLENSRITANAVRGAGGNIAIATQGLLVAPESDITASSQFGVDGVVAIIQPEVNPDAAFVELPEAFTDLESVLAGDPCRNRDSEFYFVGRGGIPPNPTGETTPNASAGDRLWIALPDTISREDRVSHDGQRRRLVEATGWAIDDRGNVALLVADRVRGDRCVVSE